MSKQAGLFADNVISLAAFRAQMVRGPKGAGAACPAGGKDTIYFITGGHFEAMVNGVVAVISAGQFARVPDGAAFDFFDIGLMPGTMLSHRFADDAPPGFLSELALALPPFTSALPSRDTAAYARLKAIARRWGTTLGTDEAA